MLAPRLYDQVRERIRVKHYSLRTEDAYLLWIRRLIFFHGKRRPREIRTDRPLRIGSRSAANPARLAPR